PPGALAAGSAFPTGLVLVELGPAQHRTDHTGGLVEDLQCARAQHRAGVAHTLEVERDVEVLCGENGGAGPARGPELQLMPRTNAAAEVDQRAQRDPERGLVLSRIAYVPGQREDPEAVGLLGAQGGEPVRAAVDNAGNRGD